MNPIARMREETGLSLRELAQVLGLNFWTLWRIEKGYPAGLSLLVALRLKEHGYEGDPVEDYHKWREERRKTLLGEQKKPR